MTPAARREIFHSYLPPRRGRTVKRMLNFGSQFCTKILCTELCNGGAMDSLMEDVIAKVRPYTVVPDEGLKLTIRLTLEVIDKGVPGVLVECGTWKGGCSYAMLLAQRFKYGEVRRPVYLFDSYQGLPRPTPRDGDYAF